MDGWVGLERRRIVMASSWASLVLTPLEVRYHEATYTTGQGRTHTETVGQVHAMVTLALRYGLSHGTRMAIPTMLQERGVAGFLEEARKLLRRDADHASLSPECGMDVIYRWIDPDPEAIERARKEGYLTRAFCDPVLVASCRYWDLPLGGGDDARRPWWMDWSFEHSALADAENSVRVTIDDLLATRAQFERMIRALEELVQESGDRCI